ncbi:hypothetical protein LTR27_012650 [Elasticomyces elasticus]|nr:hypothetical protein LTR27_012650 [Elasticomyces elasticus]
MRAPVGRPRKVSPIEGGKGGEVEKPAVVKSLPGNNGVVTPTMTASGAQAADLDVDKLASGMKKISLKVGSREESERKAKEREAAERRARALKGAETRRVNAAARKAAVGGGGVGGGVVAQPMAVQKSAASMEAAIPPAATDGVGNGAERNGDAAVEIMPTLPPIETATNIDNQRADAMELDHEPAVITHQPEASSPPGVPEEALRISPLKAPDIDPSPSAGLDMSPSTSFLKVAESEPNPRGLFVPDSAARQLIQQNHITNGLSPLLNGNGSSPIAPLPREKAKPLPVFSSTGHIPFGPSTAPPSPSIKVKAKSTPPFSSPIRQQSLGVAAGGPGLRNISGHGNGVSRSMLDSEVEEEITQGPTPGVEEKDIWEVPDTPAK